MKIVHHANELNPNGRRVCLAIGFFDGVHLGHQQIIRQTIADARQNDGISLVVTFDRHPNTVVAPQRVPRLIYSLPQKLRVIETLGSDALLLIQFDEPFSRLSGEAFIRGLVRDLGRLQSLCVGSTFTFGYKRGGNVALLKTLGGELGFTVHGMAAVSLGGRVVSSTRIRELVAGGDLDAASQMLGRGYSIAGRVTRGDRLGHKLGFPTANLDVTGLTLPPAGVYTVRAQVAGQARRAVVNIGNRPTLRSPQPELRVEVHLLDFEGDLYDQELEITFVRKLRDEKQFPSLAALQEQIALDVAEAGRTL